MTIGSALPGTVVRIALADGSPRGLRLVDRAGWTGLVLLVGRAGYPAARANPTFDGPGVYLLRGPADPPAGLPRLYIGQADNARDRLDQHERGKPFWSELVLLTSKVGHLNRAHVQYVESRLIALAVAAQRSDVQNGNAPRPPFLPDIDRLEAEEFLREALTFLPLIGYDVFAPNDVPPPPPPPPLPLPLPLPQDEVLTLRVGESFAHGRRQGKGVLVLAGAVARAIESTSLPPGYRKLRADLIGSGVLVTKDHELTLTCDRQFASPSAAAAVLLGRHVNGLQKWKDARGRSLAEIAEEGEPGVE